MKQKFYIVLVAMLVVMLPLMNIQAQEGTAISTYEELNTLIRANMDGAYYLTNDIEIPEGTEWLPLGKPENHNRRQFFSFYKQIGRC
jgi:hypothetical protein